MPRLDSIIYLPHWHVEQASGGRTVLLESRYEEKAVCPHCGGKKVQSRGGRKRKIRHANMGMRSCYVEILAHKFKCLVCQRWFRQRFSGVLPYQRATEVFKEQVVQDHHQGIPQSVLESWFGLSHTTIERWYHYILGRWVAEIKNNPAPLEMGIDEHWWTKKEGFATSLCNLSNHRLHDVVLGKSESSIKEYLKGMKGRKETRHVSMDLSKGYRSIVRKYFPNALIVADRFHVIRLINRYFSKAYKQIEPSIMKARGMRMLLRYHEWNLEKKKPDKIDEIKKYLKEHPALLALYDFKQKLCRLLIHKHQTARQCRKLIPKFIKMIEQLKNIPIELLQRLGRTLEDWKEEIARMWRFTKNNGILEGLHNKMELISRRAYGFHNFENYRLRVRALCG
jgi:transposase